MGPVIHYTMGGLAIDVDGRVLSAKDGTPISGLYAAGEASGGVHGANRLAGNSLLECTVFGRRVGMSVPILKQLSEKPPLEETTLPAFSVPSVHVSSERHVSSEELLKHATTESAYIALYGKVYDVTDFAPEHPGGPEPVMENSGTNATEIFETVHDVDLLESMGFTPIGILTE